MRNYFHYYGLKADMNLAEAARRILEVRGIENYCLHSEEPDTPPSLTPELISFIPKSAIDKAGSQKHFYILSKKLYDLCYEHYDFNGQSKKADSVSEWEQQHEWVDIAVQGSTDAEGYQEEVWCLLLWVTLHGYDCSLRTGRIGRPYDIRDAAQLYEQAFGEALEPLLPQILETDIYESYRRAFQEALIPVTFDNMEQMVEYAYDITAASDMSQNLSKAASRALFFGATGEASIHVLSGIYLGIRMTELLDALSFGLEPLEKYDQFRKLLPGKTEDLLSEMLTKMSQYQKLWEWIAAIVHGVDEEEYRDRRHGKRIDIPEEMFAKANELILGLKGIPLKNLVESSIKKYQLEYLIDMIQKGVPIEDITA